MNESGPSGIYFHVVSDYRDSFEAWRFRRSGGTARGPKNNPQLLLTTTGPKSGKQRTVPLFFTRDGDRLVVIASYAGSDVHPAWWLNLRSGIGTVEIDTEKYDVTPTVLEDPDRERLWRKMTEFWPDYDKYTTKTARRIPVVALSRT